MLFPHTESRRISMRLATAKDAPRIYDILFRSGRSGLPLLDTFVESFGRGLAACFVVSSRDTDQVIGCASLSELAPPAGHVRVEATMALGQPAELTAEVVALTTNFAFAMWRLRKVYLHSIDASLASLGFGPEHSAMIRNEAVFSDHVYRHGRTWDVNVFAIYREQWDTHGVDFLKQIL